MRREPPHRKMLTRLSILSKRWDVTDCVLHPYFICAVSQRRRERWLSCSSSSSKRAAQPESMRRGFTSSNLSAGDATPPNWFVFSFSIFFIFFFFLLILWAVAFSRARSTTNPLIPSTSSPPARSEWLAETASVVVPLPKREAETAAAGGVGRTTRSGGVRHAPHFIFLAVPIPSLSADPQHIYICRIPKKASCGCG